MRDAVLRDKTTAICLVKLSYSNAIHYIYSHSLFCLYFLKLWLSGVVTELVIVIQDTLIDWKGVLSLYHFLNLRQMLINVYVGSNFVGLVGWLIRALLPINSYWSFTEEKRKERGLRKGETGGGEF